jgi:hypothetical protein
VTTLKRFYGRIDTWARALSQTQYAVFLGLSGGIGVLLAGLAFTQELLVVQALAMALVMVTLEYTFGLHHSTES